MSKRIGEQEAQEIRELAAQGLTPGAIAKRLGRSPTSLYEFFDRKVTPRRRTRTNAEVKGKQ